MSTQQEADLKLQAHCTPMCRSCANYMTNRCVNNQSQSRILFYTLFLFKAVWLITSFVSFNFLCVHFVCRTMSVPENNSPVGSLRDDDGDPPSLSIEVKKLSDLPKISKQWSNVHLPVDILILTVENCEFLACHYYLRDAFKSYSQTLGYVYFGNMGDQDKPWKVALVKCSKGSSDPGGSQTAAANAVTLLRPKITFCVGFCEGLNHENTNLGDVVISCKFTTDAYKTPVSRDVGNLVRNAADG